MLTIKFLDLATHETATENFASYAIFELFDDEISPAGVAVMEWFHTDENGKRTGGGSGCNACVSLRACHAGLTTDEIDDIHYQMSVNCD